jgi:uncharacterized coiled-coil DUF342 family protein
MNAFIREKHEVPMAKQESIEVYIEPLRTGLSEVRGDVRELRADSKTLRDKIDQVREKVDQVRDRIDQLRDKMDDGFRASDAKITKLTEAIAGMRGLQMALLWIVGGVGSLATVLITVGKALHWF